MIGGSSDAAVRRVVTWGAGWTLGGAPAEVAHQTVPKIKAAWQEAGRDGEPRLAALAYFSLGDDAEEASRTYLRDYYGFTGPFAEQIADRAIRTDDAVRGAVKAFEDAGITELTFDPTTTSLDQIDRLADLVL
jgi:alkanesulfonate monooxygenase SsuD/methylene tetrahydromethanopterin reductase-like flavin-dependent oxidoreductase (luciferase family)